MMKRTRLPWLVALIAWTFPAATLRAQLDDFDSELSRTGTVAMPPAALAQPASFDTGSAADPGQPVPQNISPYNYGWGRDNWYTEQQFKNLRDRYFEVNHGLGRLAASYPFNSYWGKYVLKIQENGQYRWDAYSRYQDATSAWNLETWVSHYERYLYQYGLLYYRNQSRPYNYGNYGYYPTSWNPSWSGYTTYRYPNYTPYYTVNRVYYGTYGYPSAYYGGSGAYAHSMGLADGIGHLVHGSRHGNDLEIVGGGLTTAGNILNIVGGRRW